MEEFWELTPAEFSEFSERYQESFEARYIVPVVQFAQFASFWANGHIAEGNRKTTPDDFIPKLVRNVVQPPEDPAATSLMLMSMWEAAYPRAAAERPRPQT